MTQNTQGTTSIPVTFDPPSQSPCRRPSRWQIWLLSLLLGLGVFLAWSPPLQARSICRPAVDHTVCIESIRRSAKYHWQYRVRLTIDGQPRPLETYDCRYQQRVRSDGTRISFTASGPGPLICRLVER